MYKKMLVLRFPDRITDKPIVCTLSRDYDLCFNIIKAAIIPGEEGIMILEVSGYRENVKKGLADMREMGVDVKPVEQEITRNDELCIQCGACTAFCPTDALSIDPETREVKFVPGECKACEMCLAVCPVKAMEIRFSRDKVKI